MKTLRKVNVTRKIVGGMLLLHIEPVEIGSDSIMKRKVHARHRLNSDPCLMLHTILVDGNLLPWRLSAQTVEMAVEMGAFIRADGPSGTLDPGHLLRHVFNLFQRETYLCIWIPKYV